jgi:predicted ATP-grasp superfamily ATP-dependent carboligase
VVTTDDLREHLEQITELLEKLTAQQEQGDQPQSQQRGA